jgi:hypothetical protein
MFSNSAAAAEQQNSRAVRVRSWPAKLYQSQVCIVCAQRRCQMKSQQHRSAAQCWVIHVCLHWHAAPGTHCCPSLSAAQRCQAQLSASGNLNA